MAGTACYRKCHSNKKHGPNTFFPRPTHCPCWSRHSARRKTRGANVLRLTKTELKARSRNRRRHDPGNQNFKPQEAHYHPQ
eukprot:1432593-Amphidinium_carterae.1